MPPTKRTATTELNHDNWDKEEEPEDAGVFKEASVVEMNNRIIKKARRRLEHNVKTTENNSVFQSFKGFAATPAFTSSSQTKTPNFAFLSNIQSTSSTQPSFIKAPSSEESRNKASESSSQQQGQPISTEYYAKLKGLNEAFLDWIHYHVERNPTCVLTPIFYDYERYVKEISLLKYTPTKSETKVTSESPFNTNGSVSANARTADTEKPGPSGFRFANSFASTDKGSNSSTDKSSSTKESLSNIASDSDKKKEEKTHTFNLNTTWQFPKTSSAGQEAFSFAKAYNKDVTAASTSGTQKISNTATSPTTEFSFTGNKPFSFAAAVAKPEVTSMTKSDDQKDEDEDNPPQVEFTPVVENDSIFSKRCKLYYKSGSNYTDHGIGTLHIKPVDKSDKKQLIIRADTNLGNILLNLILNSSIPVKRVGKNGLILVCIPTPEADQPKTVLIKVKTTEDADELFKSIEENKS